MQQRNAVNPRQTVTRTLSAEHKPALVLLAKCKRNAERRPNTSERQRRGQAEDAETRGKPRGERPNHDTKVARCTLESVLLLERGVTKCSSELSSSTPPPTF